MSFLNDHGPDFACSCKNGSSNPKTQKGEQGLTCIPTYEGVTIRSIKLFFSNRYGIVVLVVEFLGLSATLPYAILLTISLVPKGSATGLPAEEEGLNSAERFK